MVLVLIKYIDGSNVKHWHKTQYVCNDAFTGLTYDRNRATRFDNETASKMVIELTSPPAQYAEAIQE